MKKNILIKFQAAFLIFIFSINMIVGCLCALGLNMGFNSIRHAKLKECTDSDNCYDEDCEHHESKEGKDNCCNDHVIKFSQLDKSLPQVFAGTSAIFFSALISSFYYIDILHSFKGYANTSYYVRNHHPPIPDIRLAIQSFQI